MDKERILGQVRRCLAHLGEGGGYLIDGEAFEITESREVNGGTEYSFRVDAYRESDFTDEDEGPGSVPESIEGSIALDGEFQPLVDPDGHVRLKPWRCLDPRTMERKLPEGPPDILS